jgi:hypothetical protein
MGPLGWSPKVLHGVKIDRPDFYFQKYYHDAGGYHPGITARKGNVSNSKSENGQAFHFLCRWAFHFLKMPIYT